jgi:polysaccharide pyruvyl transferase WcaK-like protein
MDPDTPRPDAGINVPSGAVGFSASQLMSRYVTGGDMAQWRQTAGAIVRRIVADTGHPVLLVPHCTGTEHVDADHVLLAGIQEDLQPDLGDAVTMLPTNLSAAQTKHCIARCEAFVGSRTHSTIAAMSSLVPTVSLAYSVKAPGINTMVFGDTRYCIAPQCQTPEHVSCVLKEALAARTEIRDMLAARIPEIQQKAWIAGEYLARVLTTTGGNKP